MEKRLEKSPEKSPEPFFSIVQLQHYFGYSKILDGLNLTLQTGQITAICGDNGSGKSTLLYLMTRLAPPQQGQMYWQGQALDSPHTRRKFLLECAFLGPDSLLFPELSLEQNLQLFARIDSISIAAGERREFNICSTTAGDGDAATATTAGDAAKLGSPAGSTISETSRMLSAFGLRDYRHHLLETFSSGMKQKAALLTMLRQRASLFLFDEPFSYLDAKGCQVLWQFLWQLRASGKIILLCMQSMQSMQSMRSMQNIPGMPAMLGESNDGSSRSLIDQSLVLQNHRLSIA